MTLVDLHPPGGHRVVTAGQSLNNFPTPQPTYRHIMVRGLAVTVGNIAINAAPWAALDDTVTADVENQASVADSLSLWMLGGQTDIALGATAAALYATASAYATAARAAGATDVICLTLPFFPSFDSAENTVRLDHNALLVADADEAFDTVIDIADDVRLQSEGDYIDSSGHPTIAGAEVIASYCRPVLEAILAPAAGTYPSSTTYPAADLYPGAA